MPSLGGPHPICGKGGRWPGLSSDHLAVAIDNRISPKKGGSEVSRAHSHEARFLPTETVRLTRVGLTQKSVSFWR